MLQDPKLLAAAFTLFGAVLVAVFNAVWSRHRFLREERLRLKLAAYAAYLEALGEMSAAQKALLRGQAMGLSEGLADTLFEKLAEKDGALQSAKARLSVYGESEVIARLAAFEKAGASFDSPARLQAFIAVIAAMRAEGGLSSASGDLALLLLGPEGAKMHAEEERQA